MRRINKIWTRISVVSLMIFLIFIVVSSYAYSQDPNDPLEPDTVWVGKGKGYGVSNRAFPIPVWVFNDWDLAHIFLPLRIQELSAFANLDSICFIDRLAPDTILDTRAWYHEGVDWISPDSFWFWAHTYPGFHCFTSGSGNVLNLWFTADSIGLFVIDTCRFNPGPTGGLWFGDCIPEWEWIPVFVADTIEIRKCGDVNQDDEVTIADAVYLVNYVFKSGPEPVPVFLLGEVNEDNNIDIIDVVFLINYLFEDGDPPCDLSYPQCKTFQTGVLADTIPPDQDCIEYQYDGEGTLVLNHINAGFNCCPSSLTADISIEQSLITVIEYEHFDNTGPCYCLCLFDVDYQINNLPPGEYTIKVNEVYLEEGDELLEFTVNLPPSPYSGSFCVFRSHYPWMP